MNGSGPANPVKEIDANSRWLVRNVCDIDALELDALFPSFERVDDAIANPPARRYGIRFVEELAKSASEFRSHQLLTGRRAQEHDDRLSDAGLQ